MIPSNPEHHRIVFEALTRRRGSIGFRASQKRAALFLSALAYSFLVGFIAGAIIL